MVNPRLQRRRPWPLWLIVAYLALSVLLALPGLVGLGRVYLEPPVALYALGGLGIVSGVASAVALFRLKAIAILFLLLTFACTAASGVVRFATADQARLSAAGSAESLQQQVVQSFAIGLAINAGIIGYAIWSRKRGILR